MEKPTESESFGNNEDLTQAHDTENNEVIRRVKEVIEILTQISEGEEPSRLLDSKDAELLLENELDGHELRYTLTHYLEHFQGVDYEYVVQRSIEPSLDKYNDDLTAAYSSEGDYIAGLLGKYSEMKIDPVLIRKIVESSFRILVFLNEDGSSLSFEPDDTHKRMSLVSLGYFIAHNIDEYDLDKKDIAERLIIKGQGGAVLRNENKFAEAISREEIIDSMIENNQFFDAINALGQYLNWDTYKKMIEQDMVESIVKGMSSRRATILKIDAEVAIDLIDLGYASLIKRAIERKSSRLEIVGDDSQLLLKLDEIAGLRELAALDDGYTKIYEPGLSDEVAVRFIEAGQIRAVCKDLYRFSNLSASTLKKLSDYTGYDIRCYPYNGTEGEKDAWFGDYPFLYTPSYKEFTKQSLGRYIRSKKGIE